MKVGNTECPLEDVPPELLAGRVKLYLTGYTEDINDTGEISTLDGRYQQEKGKISTPEGRYQH